MALANQRIVYLNGEFIPESEARVPIKDQGFKFGDAVFDTTRTFGHEIFKLRDHLERFERSMRYLKLDGGHSIDDFVAVTEEIVRRNLPLIASDEDYWVTQRVSRGLSEGDREAWPDWPDATVIVECTPLPLAARAKSYRDGIEVITPSVRRVAPEMASPRAKTHNYLNLILGDLEVAAQNPDALSVLLDRDGNLAEGKGSNIFLVSEGKLRTPRERFVLPGVSRQVTKELAARMGLEVEETDIDLFDAYNADEAFITSTSFCICPIRSINGRTMAEGRIPGPITKKLISAYVDMVGFDWYAQYLSRLA
ncbi:MAG: aminotransferase class IV [Alphaproteobacteria bacterium]|nr:aminotransferase class IV [Alphaproteobacteria bacterium]